MILPVFNGQQWLEKLNSLPRVGTESVTAFYEHRIGAICKDTRCLLVPLNDHLVHRGDGVFESLHLGEGKIFQLDAHMARLKNSAAVLKLQPPLPWDSLREVLIAVAKEGGEPCGSLKVLLGRGEGGMGISPSECPTASFFCIASKSSPLPQSYWEKGLTACKSAVPAKQPYLAQIKSTNYLPNVFMAMEAAEHGVSVSFAFDEAGYLAEAAIANVAVVTKNNELLMPPFQHALPGTTALLAKKLAEAFMPVILTDIKENILYEAAEILVLGTTPECVAVTHYEGQPVGNGKPGPVSSKLRACIHAALLEGGTPFLSGR